MLGSFAYPDRARRRAQDVATSDQVLVWVHRSGPQRERFIEGGPDPGTDYEVYEPSTNPAGSFTK